MYTESIPLIVQALICCCAASWLYLAALYRGCANKNCFLTEQLAVGLGSGVCAA